MRELHGSGLVPWDLKNEDGSKVASAAYLILVKSSDGLVTKFLEVIQ